MCRRFFRDFIKTAYLVVVRSLSSISVAFLMESFGSSFRILERNIEMSREVFPYYTTGSPASSLWPSSPALVPI